MKLAIVGSRSLENRKEDVKRAILNNLDSSITEIVSGGAKGVDSIAKEVALELDLEYSEFLPDWNKYGKSAGFKRNSKIIEYVDEVLAIWDGVSKGTTHSFELAKQQGKPLQIIEIKA